MAASLGVSEADIAAGCSNATYAFNAADYTNRFTAPSFTTTNGMRWRIVQAIPTSLDANEAHYQTDIYVDVDPSNNETPDGDMSCIYNADTCTEPDIFKFIVAANGHVTPADPMGKKYIEERKNLIKKNVEITDHEIDNESPFVDFTYELATEHSEEELCIANGKFWYNDSCHDCEEGLTLQDGVCRSAQEICALDNMYWYNEVCNQCPQGQVLTNGVCQEPEIVQQPCDGIWYNGSCRECPSGYTFDASTGECREPAKVNVYYSARTSSYGIIYKIVNIETTPKSDGYGFTFRPIQRESQADSTYTCVGTHCIGLQIVSGGGDSDYWDFKNKIRATFSYVAADETLRGATVNYYNYGLESTISHKDWQRAVIDVHFSNSALGAYSY